MFVRLPFRFINFNGHGLTISLRVFDCMWLILECMRNLVYTIHNTQFCVTGKKVYAHLLTFCSMKYVHMFDEVFKSP